MNEAERARGWTKAVNEFIGRSFWIVGSFCFFWETLVVAALYRVSPDVELPLLGKCSGGEAIVLTLTFFWPVLLALHWLVHAHQSLTRGRPYSARFPGVLGDKEIPAPLTRFRVLLFFLLLFWPSIAHIILTVRGFTHMSIVYNVDGEAYQVSDGAQSNEVKLLEHRGWAQLAPLSQPRDCKGAAVKGEWRWLHWRDKKELVLPADGGKPGRKVVRPERWPTAIPLIQPWGFLLVAIALSLSTPWLIVRAWMRK
jgi:hypothetical protein